MSRDKNVARCCRGGGSDEEESETSSSEEDEVVYVQGARVLRTAGDVVGSNIEEEDDDDCTLEQVRDRHGEELDSLYAEMMEELMLSRAIQGLSPPYKTYIDYLRERGRFDGE